MDWTTTTESSGSPDVLTPQRESLLAVIERKSTEARLSRSFDFEAAVSSSIANRIFLGKGIEAGKRISHPIHHGAGCQSRLGCNLVGHPRSMHSDELGSSLRLDGSWVGPALQALAITRHVKFLFFIHFEGIR